MIYLRATLQTLQIRIRLRKRAYEHSICSDCLRHLNHLYENWIAGYDLSNVLIAHTNQTDFVTRPSDTVNLKAKLERFGLRPVLL